MAPPTDPRTDADAELREVQRMLARERLAFDEPAEDRTCFLSHVGAQPKLVPGAWIAHRDLVYAMALSNLNPVQRESLARAVLVEHGDTFGVGRLELQAIASGLPLGGSSVLLRARKGGPRCLYTWALGSTPARATCEWLLLRAQPEWALDEPPRAFHADGLATLAALGGEVVVLVASAVGALQIARACAGKVSLAAHPRFSPYIEGLTPEAPVLLWPHDALDAAGLRRRTITALVLVGAPEAVRHDVAQWRTRQPSRVEVVEATCPGRIDRGRLAAMWRDCGGPRVLVRGDVQWAAHGARMLAGLGAHVQVQGEATQLDLL